MYFANIVINFRTLLLRHIRHALHVKSIRLFNKIDRWHVAIYIDWPIKQTVSLQEHKCLKVKNILRCDYKTIPSFNRDKHYILVIRTLIMSGRLNSNPYMCILVTPPPISWIGCPKNINLNSWDNSLLPHPTILLSINHLYRHSKRLSYFNSLLY